MDNLWINFSQTKTYSYYQEILNNGFTLHYYELTEFIHQPMSKEDMEFVLEILDLYSTMNLAVSRSEKYQGKSIYFPGFDGNHESKYIDYTRFFMFRLNRFEDLKKENTYESYNAHETTVCKYKKMLNYWNESSGDNKFILSDEQLDTLIEMSVSGTLEENHSK